MKTAKEIIEAINSSKKKGNVPIVLSILEEASEAMFRNLSTSQPINEADEKYISDAIFNAPEIKEFLETNGFEVYFNHHWERYELAIKPDILKT